MILFLEHGFIGEVPIVFIFSIFVKVFRTHVVFVIKKKVLGKKLAWDSFTHAC